MPFISGRQSPQMPDYEQGRVPTLSFEEFLALDELSATEVASATASAILRAAQARHEELLADATRVVDDAQARALELSGTAAREVDARRREAELTASKVLADAEASARGLLETTRAQVETLRTQAEAAAVAMREEAERYLVAGGAWTAADWRGMADVERVAATAAASPHGPAPTMARSTNGVLSLVVIRRRTDPR
jgi:cell division septum initiation protein DivIVA